MISPDDESLYAFRTNMVVAASAGTGKTFRLVTLYVLLVLGLTSKGKRDERTAEPPISPLRIGATTFSRSAAAEIRARVERLLAAVASGDQGADSAAYRAILDRRAETLGQPDLSSRVMRHRAEQALAELPSALI